MEEKDDAHNNRSPSTHDDNNNNGHHRNDDDDNDDEWGDGPTTPLKHDDDFHYDPISVKEPEGLHTCKDTITITTQKMIGVVLI